MTNHTIGKCPCINETSDALDIRSNTNTLIITVHGTNAQHAEWTYKGKLVHLLTNKNPNTQISRFCWSGGNSHSKRLLAAKELADYIRNLSKKYPKIQFFLLGHSHGGNVIMYALNKLRGTNFENKIKKVVTIATPYLYMKLRKLNPIIIFSSLFATLFCLIELKLGGWQVSTISNYLATMVIVIFALWQLLVLISIFFYGNRIKRLWQYLKILIGKDRNLSILENDISDFEFKHINSEVKHDRFETSRTIARRKHLIIRPVGDEATMALTVSQFLSWINIHLLKFLSNICDKYINDFFRMTKEYFYRFGDLIDFSPTHNRMPNEEFRPAIFKFILMAPLIIFLGRIILPKISEKLEGIGADNLDLFLFPLFGWFLTFIILTFIFNAAILCFLGIISVLSLFFMTLSALAFGLDAVFWSHFAHTTVESTPPGLFDVYVHPSNDDNKIETELDLAHSLIYNEYNVIIKIRNWLFKD